MLPNVIEAIFQKIFVIYCSILMYFITFIKDIKLEKGCKFYGHTKFKKVKKGLIQIGHNCTFRSTATSNLIGINRKCIISAIGNGTPRIIVGDSCGFSGTVIGCFSEIIIESNVRCGANTLITDGDWHFNDVRSGAPRPVYIEENVWLGVNVIVLKGVRIGRNSVIGAGSVVTKNIPSNVIAVGNPCRVVKKLSFFEDV